MKKRGLRGDDLSGGKEVAGAVAEGARTERSFAGKGEL